MSCSLCHYSIYHIPIRFPRSSPCLPGSGLFRDVLTSFLHCLRRSEPRATLMHSPDLRRCCVLRCPVCVSLCLPSLRVVSLCLPSLRVVSDGLSLELHSPDLRRCCVLRCPVCVSLCLPSLRVVSLCLPSLRVVSDGLSLELHSPDLRRCCVLRCPDRPQLAAWLSALHSALSAITQQVTTVVASSNYPVIATADSLAP